jgi:hypothetical protein
MITTEKQKKSKEYQKEYRIKNKLLMVEKNKEYYQKNKLKIKEYYEKNKLLIQKTKKEYKIKNKLLIQKKRKEYYEKNYEKNKLLVQKKSKEYRIKNKLLMREKRKEYTIKNKLLVVEKIKEYYEKNKKRLNKKRKEYNKKRRVEDISFRISSNIRGRVSHALKSNSKSSKTFDLLGCDIAFLKQYLESKFKDGMCWENYGLKGWHIDHIKPCYLFNFKNIEEQKQCFHYTNLQPLSAIDNLIKGKKWENIL